jgi:L-fuculose-phosphate aldolase
MPSPPLPKLRAEVVKVSRRLHTMGWVANHDGNVSVRLTGKRLLITPTAVSKLDVDDSMLLVVDEKGTVLEGRRKAFSELELHLAVYRARPDVECVLHAHPPHATAFGLAGLELGPVAMPEIVVSLGDSIPTVPRLMPKTPELVKAVEAAAGRVDAMLLAGNGALTMGDSLEQALLRMELVEHYARILAVARALGPVPALPAGDVAKLLEARAKAGLGPKPRS